MSRLEPPTPADAFLLILGNSPSALREPLILDSTDWLSCFVWRFNTETHEPCIITCSFTFNSKGLIKLPPLLLRELYKLKEV